MSSSWIRHAAIRAVALAVTGFGLAASPLLGAVTVTNAGVKAGTGSGVIIFYTLNEPATAVQIALSNGTNLTGGTAKGRNEVAYAGAVSGVSATITATASAENGVGGANVLVPVTAPSTGFITGLAYFNRSGSAYQGQLLVAAGFLQSSKSVYRMAGDGTILKTGDLKAIAGSGSWPFGVAVGQDDSQDRVWIPNRSLRVVSILNPSDLTQLVSLPTTYTYVGTQVTPLRDGTGVVQPDQFNFFVGGNNTAGGFGAVYQYSVNLSVTPPTISALTSVGDTTDAAGTNQSIAVDPTSSVMFKAHKTALGTAGTQSLSLSKWTSPDYGSSWVEDSMWTTQVTTSIGVADGVPYGVTLDKGFNAADPANSYVWVAISGGVAGTNKIFRVNAATGDIDAGATIDLTLVAVPSGTASIGDKPLRYIAADYNGNLAVAVQAGTAAYTDVAGSHYAILAPNTAAATTSSLALASVEPPLSASGATDNVRVGNTGDATVNYSVDVFDSAGIVADNVHVTADLSAIGGGATVALTRGTVSADGKSATFTASQKVPASAAPGTVNLPFTVIATSGSLVTKVAQTVYQAYVPSWKASVSGAVTGAASNGAMSYIGTDSGNVYAFNADGTPAANFGGGSAVNIGEPVTHRLVAANGRLYVPGTSRLFILDIGTGAQTGSFAVSTPSSAAANSADPSVVYVGGGDNKVHALDANTGVEKFASADLGGAVNEPSVGASFTTSTLTLLVAGTESGSIVMLNPGDLSQAFPPFTDTNGAVRSKAAFVQAADFSANYFYIGGASGLWGVNAETGATLTWPTDATHNGNPYTTVSPVDADPTTTANGLRVMFADTSGNLYIIIAADGGKLSFSGIPAGLTTPPGTGGFADNAGILLTAGAAASDNTTATRMVYIGSDTNDRRFFALNALPDDSTFGVTPQNLRTFDPNDTATFPGETAGGFMITPAPAGDKIVVGSTAGRVYGFNGLVVPDPYVTAVTPAAGARGVPPNQVVSVTFSDAVNYGAFNVIRLLRDGQDVPGVYELSQDSKTLSFTPSSPLSDKTSYVFVIQGMTTLDATRPVAPFSSSFYVGTPAPVQGDVNGDLTFNLQDVAEALRMAGGLQAATPAAVTATGNKVTSGSITVEDAVFLARVKAGLASF